LQKANDLIWKFDASRDHEPSAKLELIQARVLALNFADDQLNLTLSSCITIAQIECGRATTKFDRAEIQRPPNPESS
jgi:hypothetical protein